MKLHYLLILFIVLPLFGDDSAECARVLRHLLRNPVKSTTRWQWAEVLKEKDKPLMGDGDLLPEDHPVTRRTQFWLDELDAALRSEYATMMKNVPKPKAYASSDSSPNASVNKVDVYYRAPVELNASVPTTKENTIAAVVIKPNRAGLSGNLEDGLDYDLQEEASSWQTERKLTKEEAIELSKWCSGNLSSCIFTVEEDASRPEKFKIVLDKKSKVESSSESLLNGKAQAEGFVFPAVGNQVHVSASLLTKYKNEEEFVAVLAHELGHYYRAHGINMATDYGYFYEAKPNEPYADAPPKAPPVMHQEMQTIAKQISEASLLLDGYHSIPEQKIPSALVTGALMAAEQLATIHSQDKSCIECPILDSLLKNQSELIGADTYRYGSGFPKDPLPDKNMEKFRQFETAFLSLAARTQIEASDNLVPGKVPLDKVKGYFKYELDKTPWYVDPSKYQTLGDYFAAATSEVRRAESSLVDAYNKAKALRMGHFTHEQEADEQSLHMLALIGIKPDTEAQEILTLGKALEPTRGLPAPPVLSSQTAEKLLNLNRNKTVWKDEKGETLYVPMGNPDEPHHYMSYRSYHMSTRTAALGLNHLPAVRTPVLPTDMNWLEVVEAAKEVYKKKNP